MQVQWLDYLCGIWGRGVWDGWKVGGFENKRQQSIFGLSVDWYITFKFIGIGMAVVSFLYASVRPPC